MRGIMSRSQILLSLTLLCFGLSSCGLTGLNENTKPKFNTELSTHELNEITQSKEARNLIDNNWKQSKLFKHEDLACTYCVILDENKELKDLILTYVFCDKDHTSDECQELVKLSKQTILTSILALKAEKYKNYPDRFCLHFASAAGNRLYKQSIIENRLKK